MEMIDDGDGAFDPRQSRYCQ